MKILIIVKNDLLLKAISLILQEENYEVDLALPGEKGLWKVETEIYDLLILEILPPKMDSLSYIKEFRRKSIGTPILFLNKILDSVVGIHELMVEGDDYLIEPFGMGDLLTRVNSLLQRSGKRSIVGVIKYGKIFLSTIEHDAFVNNERLKLTNKEYIILHCLAQSPEQIITCESLSERILGLNAMNYKIDVDLHFQLLRNKLAEYGLENLIHTIKGVGYMLKEK